MAGPGDALAILAGLLGGGATSYGRALDDRQARERQARLDAQNSALAALQRAASLASLHDAGVRRSGTGTAATGPTVPAPSMASSGASPQGPMQAPALTPFSRPFTSGMGEPGVGQMMAGPSALGALTQAASTPRAPRPATPPRVTGLPTGVPDVPALPARTYEPLGEGFEVESDDSKLARETAIKQATVAAQMQRQDTLNRSAWTVLRQQYPDMVGDYSMAMDYSKLAEKYLDESGKRLVLKETERHDQATEGVQRGQLGVSQATLAEQRRHNIASESAASAKGLRPVPPSALKTIIDNQKALSTLDVALDGVKTAPGAFGPTNFLGLAAVKDQLGAPEADVHARAAVGDIGSMIIHDRSGTAVTVSEMPRLKPFIPATSDRPEVVRTKLQRLRDAIQLEHDLYMQNYDEGHGYRSPTMPASASPGLGAPSAPGAQPSAPSARAAQPAQSGALQTAWDRAEAVLRAQGRSDAAIHATIGERP